MNEPLDDGKLLELAALPPDDPRRAEAAKDPRVRAWLLEHDAFVAGAPLGPEEAGRVGRATEAALAKAHEGAAGGGGRVIEMPRASRAPGGVPRWALAAAAVVVVAGAMVLMPRHAGHPREDHLRSLAPGGAPVAFAGREAGRDASGRLVLAWTPDTAAVTYRVEVLSGLTTVATFDAGAADSLALDTTGLPAGPLVWRVLAIRDGETVATSAPRELPR